MSVNDLIGYPKRLLCRLTQTGAAAPVIAAVVINTLTPRLPAITYTGPGTFAGLFVDAVMLAGQTSMRFQPMVPNSGAIDFFYSAVINSGGLSPTGFLLSTWTSGGVLADGIIGPALISSAWFEIMVYP